MTSDRPPLAGQLPLNPTESSPERLFTAPFFLLFATLLAYMCGFGMLVHLPKYVERLGGDIVTISYVFGIGKLGSLLTRPFVGRWIDRTGCQPVLGAATLGAAAAILAMQWVDDVRAVTALRGALELTSAALLATVAVFAARIAPHGRSAESLAMIGVGGLAGFMLGPVLGDWMLRGETIDPVQFTWFFCTGSFIVLLSGGLVLANRSPAPIVVAATHHEPWRQVLRRCWPGPLVVMGLCLALVQTIPVMFIERFVIQTKLSGVAWFFLAYSPTAMVLRLVLRRVPGRIGRRRTLLFGMSCYAAGLLALVGVDTDAGLVLPAIVMGMGHCFSYPFLVDLAASHAPQQHRGLATSLILGVIDVGFLIAFVVEGQSIKRFGFGPTLTATALTAGVCIAWYAWTQRNHLMGRRPD